VEVVWAYRVARDVSQAVPRWKAVEELTGKIQLDVWYELMTGADRVVASLARQYLGRFQPGTLEKTIAEDSGPFEEFEQSLPNAGPKEWQELHEAEEAAMVEAGVPVEIARRYAFRRQLVHAPDAIELAAASKRSVADVAAVMFHAGQAMGLDRLESIAAGFRFTDPWQRWALETLEDDIVGIRRRLAERVLEDARRLTPEEAVARFIADHEKGAERLTAFLRGLGTDQPENLAPLMIGVRQLRALIG
jgi:NAD-specific glutamate dehydrogenase